MSGVTIRLRALEPDDLDFVHTLNNDSKIMTYWFEEPYESLQELREIYAQHIHDNRERRFVIEAPEGVRAGIVELVEIDYIHRTAEFQIIVAPGFQGRGYAREATTRALDYAFAVLNLHKVYLIVSVENPKAIHIYQQAGFVTEGELREEYFADGRYRNALRMGILQHEHLGRTDRES
ncbi:spermidine N1-acetyltransferase [Kineosporia rhizophila]|uniref:spermidine N1-acetyltransferase n=1 Tax=Kineosporia TaxID=49184 RepID=UPI000A924A33|nr:MULTISPECIES: spermidine N1-acetyltransferase [Kineosporia]MCE0538164.1 spermidine N1-acetyltransferase [Kineosporia rhizophila]GLY14998.1 spermidine N(1)-acetyltransferase [Kineosporia sp. NBRC 101677]